jgi:hypothetical protein
VKRTNQTDSNAKTNSIRTSPRKDKPQYQNPGIFFLLANTKKTDILAARQLVPDVLFRYFNLFSKDKQNKWSSLM